MRTLHLTLLLALIVAATTAQAATLQHAQGRPEPSRGATTDVADAAMRGDHQALRAAIARKANVDAPQADGSTALHWAAERDDLAAADLLIKAGARVVARTREGVTPLQLAAINGSARVIEKLVKAGADPNAALTPSEDTALMLAARTGGTATPATAPRSRR